MKGSLDGHTCVVALERLARDTRVDGDWDRDRSEAYSKRVAAIHRGCPICGRLTPTHLMPAREEATA